MKTAQKKWTKQEGWVTITPDLEVKPHLVFVFGNRGVLSDNSHFDEIHNMYPDSHILTASTAGEIINNEVLDESIVLTAVYFEKTTLQFVQETIANPSESSEIGKKLATSLPHEGLIHVMVFSDGLKVNGTPLVQGLGEVLPKTVSV